MAKKIQPLHDRILVRRLEEGEKKYGGIIIPDTAKEKPQQGEVVAVGKGKIKKDGTHAGPAVKVGDKVLFGKWAGDEFEYAGEKLLFVSEDEILAIL